MFIFGPGDFYGVPLFDASGNAIANPTPIHVGTMQEMALEISSDLKSGYGQNQVAILQARGKMDVSGKFKGLTINGPMLNNLFFGQTQTSGTQMDLVTDLTGAAIPATPFQITPSVPNSGTFVADMGVTDANGMPYTRVASAPATGQYSVTAGVYLFAAADTGKTVFINYQYSYALTAAKKISVQNLAMGAAPSFKALLRTSYNGKKALVIAYGCIANKLTLFSTKLDDFTMPEIDFKCIQDPTGTSNILDAYYSE